MAVLRKTNYVYFSEKKLEEPEAPAHGKIIEDILTEHLLQSAGGLDLGEEEKAQERSSLKLERPEKGTKMQNFKTAENYSLLGDEESRDQILEYYGLRKVPWRNARKSAATST